eukprot:3670885-Pyramimonas_sp.AAC.1
MAGSWLARVASALPERTPRGCPRPSARRTRGRGRRTAPACSRRRAAASGSGRSLATSAPMMSGAARVRAAAHDAMADDGREGQRSRAAGRPAGRGPGLLRPNLHRCSGAPGGSAAALARIRSRWAGSMGGRLAPEGPAAGLPAPDPAGSAAP